MILWLLLLITVLSVFAYRHLEHKTISRHGARLTYVSSTAINFFSIISHYFRAAPDRLPLLGHAIKFIRPRHELFDWFVRCQRQHGLETLEIAVPTLPPGVIISDPSNLEFVLKNEHLISKGGFVKSRSWDLFGIAASFDKLS